MKRKTKKVIIGGIVTTVVASLLAAGAVFLMSVFDKGLSGEFLRTALKVIGIETGAVVSGFSIIGAITSIVQGKHHMENVRESERSGSAIRHTKTIEKNIDIKKIDNEVIVAKAVENQGVSLQTQIGTALASADMTVMKNALLASGAFTATVVKQEQHVAASFTEVKQGVADTKVEYSKEIK